jgi:hypothetical protein
MRVSLHRPLFCALPWAVKAGARAQATRGDTGAALSREAGTSPPPPFPRPSVSVRLWCRPDQAAAASTWPPPYLGCCPPLHNFDDHIHLDLGYFDIKGLSSACGIHRFLLQSQHTRHHDTATAGGCQFIRFYFQLILQSHRLWCSRCDCGGY